MNQGRELTMLKQALWKTVWKCVKGASSRPPQTSTEGSGPRSYGSWRLPEMLLSGSLKIKTIFLIRLRPPFAFPHSWAQGNFADAAQCTNLLNASIRGMVPPRGGGRVGSERERQQPRMHHFLLDLFF